MRQYYDLRSGYGKVNDTKMTEVAVVAIVGSRQRKPTKGWKMPFSSLSLYSNSDPATVSDDDDDGRRRLTLQYNTLICHGEENRV